MIHNDKHELKQNQAIEHLALAVQGLAMRSGASEYKRLAEDVLAMLKADDEEIPVDEAAPEAALEIPLPPPDAPAEGEVK